jgi:hypothetical protein
MSSLKNNSAATVDELREFLDGMRGKSAKEVLGKLAESGLIKAVIQATVISFLAIGAFTVGPYFLQGKKGNASAPTADKTAAAKSADAQTADSKASAGDTASGQAGGAAGASTGTAAAGAEGASAANAGTGAGPGSDIERAAKMMGVSDTKTADPKANPRERDLDNLLDKIK